VSDYTQLVLIATNRKGLLLIFVVSREARRKRSKIALIITRSSTTGDRKTTTSSAYSETRCLIERGRRGLKRPLESTRLIMALKHSMTKTNSMGERESPCLSPRPWQIRRPGTPFRRTLVLVVESKTEIQLVHRRGQPTKDNS
jgi:hypothetical protein